MTQWLMGGRNLLNKGSLLQVILPWYALPSTPCDHYSSQGTELPNVILELFIIFVKWFLFWPTLSISQDWCED